MQLWMVFLIGEIIIGVEIVGLYLWNVQKDSDDREKYQPYLNSLSCDDLKDVIIFTQNYTLKTQAQINAARCLP